MDSPGGHRQFNLSSRNKIKKAKIPIEEILKERQNFEWRGVDLDAINTQNAFVDKIGKFQHPNTHRSLSIFLLFQDPSLC